MKRRGLKAPTPSRMRVGVSAGRGERVDLEAPAWQGLRQILDSHPIDRLTLSEPLHEAPLDALDALLIGAPTQALEVAELRALRRWIRGGGRLLWLAGWGAPASTLSGLIPGLEGENLLVSPERLPAPDPPGVLPDPAAPAVVDLRLVAQASSLLGYPGTMQLEEGAALRLQPFPDAETDARGAGRIWPLGRRGLRRFTSLDTTRLWAIEGAAVRFEPAPDGAPPRRLPAARSDYVLVLLQAQMGEGSVLVFSAARSFSDRALAAADNVRALQSILQDWLGAVYPLEIQRRQREPQRHRLLQGYPMAPLMPEAPAPPSPRLADRPLIVGVLPHPLCNPSISGCGFCTFPNQPYQRSRAAAISAVTCEELQACFAAHPHLSGRRLEGIYFGGGTANLTPAPEFRAICEALGARLDVAGAEVTLEGVPRYFLHQDSALLRILSETFPSSELRISMGVQTFSPERLAEMGRERFGSRADIARALEAARGVGATASGDLLINLPGQPLEAMREDIAEAIALGFDQICLYHLVLFEGLGTAWASDPERLAALPKNPEAAANWLACRAALLEAGYTQTTLTNFEREPRFRYERSSFQPDVFDALGFGPGGISTLQDRGGAPVKWMNTEDVDAYTARVRASGWAPERAFSYAAPDQRLLYLTRQLARLRVDRARYVERFGAELLDAFAAPLDALREAGLIAIAPDAITPTPLGMFYADTIAGVLAWPRVVELRALSLLDAPGPATELDLGRYERARMLRMG